MSEIAWVRPTSLQEAVRFLKENPHSRLHGGGTGLLRRHRTTGTLVDLSDLQLEGVSVTPDRITIGAGATFSEAVSAIRQIESQHLLVQALSQAAALPLRNRITIGGSVAFFPPWSCLMGPLLALGATIGVAGADSPGATGTVDHVPVETYIRDRACHDRTLVTEVAIPRTSELVSWWYRFTRVSFDYAPFSLTITGVPTGPPNGGSREAGGTATTDGALQHTRVVVVGTTDRFDRLSVLEEHLTEPFGLSAFADPARAITDEEFPVVIPARNGFSGEYLQHTAKVALERGLRDLARRIAGGHPPSGPGDTPRNEAPERKHS